jgi:hypothetical protein
VTWVLAVALALLLVALIYALSRRG